MSTAAWSSNKTTDLVKLLHIIPTGAQNLPVTVSLFGLASVSEGSCPKPLFPSLLRLSALRRLLLLLLPSYLSQYFLNFSLGKLQGKTIPAQSQ